VVVRNQGALNKKLFSSNAREVSLVSAHAVRNARQERQERQVLNTVVIHFYRFLAFLAQSWRSWRVSSQRMPKQSHIFMERRARNKDSLID
jgi:hypothetical protein